MSTRVTVERATSDDVERIADLWVRLASEQRAHDSRVLAAENRATMREILAGHLVDDGLLVARRDGAIVGFASFTVERGALALDSTRGLLSNLYVRPEYRGRGVGTRLLRAVEDELAARDVDILSLEVLAENEAARRFYRRAGYDPHRVGMARSLDEDPSAARGDGSETPRSDDGSEPSGRGGGSGTPAARDRGEPRETCDQSDTHSKDDG